MDPPPPAQLPQPGPERGLRAQEVVWTALLGRWVEFAQASVAWPDEGDGGRWKRSVPAVIELQALIWALRDLASIDPADRPFARDRAEVMVRRRAGELDAIWGDEPMPPGILELTSDATEALRGALYAGLVELVWPGPGPFDVPAIEFGPVQGTLAIMPPGSLAMPDEPIAWWTERPGVAIDGCVARSAALGPRQVYRQLDAEGRFERDLVAPLEGELLPGLPMLVPISLAGERIGRFPCPEPEWRALQRGGLAGRSAIPVENVSPPRTG